MSEALPVIVGFGGINAAGRTSGHHAYRRMVIDQLAPDDATETWRSLATLMGLDRPIEGHGAEETREEIARETLVRRIGRQHFDSDRAPWNQRTRVRGADSDDLEFRIARRELPDPLPEGWTVAECTDDPDRLLITAAGGLEALLKTTRALAVSAAGQVPTGFEPGSLYAARQHPRAVQLALFAASDALNSLGLDWADVVSRVEPNELAVYAGTALGQLDQHGNGGLLNSRYRSKRITSKQLTLGLAEMPADFVNAYVLGSVGRTGHVMGACATYLYNLHQGAEDIRTGRVRIAFVGGAEGPIVADAIEGLATMGALVSDDGLRALEGLRADESPNFQRACRPFGKNRGFVLAEGSQFVVLMDDELADELGACVHGTVGQTFIHADGHKKSISAPGVGNYVTFARAVADARRQFGQQAVRASFVHAHGTGTPQNRVSESKILSSVARAFDLDGWPVSAVKAFVGHTMAAAGGDQLMAALGTWKWGILPGIETIDELADDVETGHLDFAIEPRKLAPEEMELAFLNAKGFGGNNATSVIVSPERSWRAVEEKHGRERARDWRRRAEFASQAAEEADRAACQGEIGLRYLFDHNVQSDEDVELTSETLRIGRHLEIRL